MLQIRYVIWNWFLFYQWIIVKESFDNIEQWLEEINKSGNTYAKKLLVGNKCDLTSKRIIDHEKAVVCKQEDKLNKLFSSFRN